MLSAGCERMCVIIRGARRAVMGSVPGERENRLCAICAMPCKQDARCVVDSCPKYVSVRGRYGRGSGDSAASPKEARHG